VLFIAIGVLGRFDGGSGFGRSETDLDEASGGGEAEE